MADYLPYGVGFEHIGRCGLCGALFLGIEQANDHEERCNAEVKPRGA